MLSTSAGHSLSPAALAELRSIATAKSPSAESLAFAVKAVCTAGPSEMATIVEAKSDSPAKAVHCSVAEQLALAPGLPPLRASLPAPQLCAPSMLVSRGTAAGAAQLRPTSAATDVPLLREGAAPSACGLPSRDDPALQGLPAPSTGSKREARRRLAFHPAAGDVASDSDADGMETLRRTVAVPSNLATLAAGGSRPVRSCYMIHVMHPLMLCVCMPVCPRQWSACAPVHTCNLYQPRTTCSKPAACPHRQVLYRTTSCSDVIDTAAASALGDGSLQRLASRAGQHCQTAALEASIKDAPDLSQLPDSAATASEVRQDLPSQICKPQRRLSSAAEALVVATSAGTAPAPAAQHSKASEPSASGGAEALRPALQLTMPSMATAATAVQCTAADAEPGTPPRAAAPAEPPEEQGSGESYNSEQGFGSPVRKRHGARVCVCVIAACIAPLSS